MADSLHGFAISHGEPASPSNALRVGVAEGQGLVRAGFRVLLERQGDMVVTADAATSDEAVAAARATCPDVVLVDVDLPGHGGMETTRRILEEAVPGMTRVVMLM